MKIKITKLTPAQKAQVLGDTHHPKPVDEFLTNIAHCAESGPLTVPLHVISRNVKILNALFERAKRNPRPVGTGIPVFVVTLN